MKYKIREIAPMSSQTVNPQNEPNTVWHLYSLPSFDVGKREEVKGSEIKSNKFIVPSRCILYNKLNVRFKRVWRVNSNEDHLIASTEFLPLVPNEDIVDYNYLYYFLISDKLTNFFDNQNSNTSGSHKRIDIDNFLNMEIDLPSIDIQKKIGRFISINDKIALNTRMNAELEAMAKQLYDYWFVQFDFPDENGNPYKSSGGKMVYNSTLKRDIPAGWEVSSYGEEFDVKLGGTPSTSEDSFWENGTINWLNSGEVQNFPINSSEKKITESALNGSSTEFLPKGSVLISITRYLRVTILNIDACINQSVAGFAETELLKYPYTYFALTAEVPRLMKLRTGAQQPHINKEIIEESPLLLPPENLLLQYYAKSSPILNTLIKRSEETEELTHLRDSLLPMLMNGQVKVEE